MTNYQRGRWQERRVGGLLKKGGAYIVTYSGGSRGAADLIALFDTCTVALQIKNHAPSQIDHDSVEEASRHTDCRWALVYIFGRNMQTWVYMRGKSCKIPVPGLRG